jgi:hypothetical protein
LSTDVGGRAASRLAVLAFVAAQAACAAQAPDREAPTASTPAAAAASSRPPAADATPATLLDVFPAGPERELVLNNCAACHNAACSAIGQRPPARWDALLASHRDRVSGVDLERVFGYLKTNFNDGKPEPKVPSALLEGGCTPF